MFRQENERTRTARKSRSSWMNLLESGCQRMSIRSGRQRERRRLRLKPRRRQKKSRRVKVRELRRLRVLQMTS